MPKPMAPRPTKPIAGLDIIGYGFETERIDKNKPKIKELNLINKSGGVGVGGALGKTELYPSGMIG